MPIVLYLSIFCILNRSTELNRKFTPRLISKFARLFYRKSLSNVNQLRYFPLVASPFNPHVLLLIYNVSIMKARKGAKFTPARLYPYWKLETRAQSITTLKEIGLPLSFPLPSQERSMDMLQAHIHTIFHVYLSSLTPIFIYRRYKIIVTHLSIS